MIYRKWRLVAIAFACVLAGIDAYAVGSSLYLREGGVTYLVLGGTVVAAVAPMLPVMAELCWSERQRIKAIFLMVMCIPVFSIIVLSAAERSSEAKDRQDQVRIGHAQRVEMMRSAVTDAEAMVSSLEKSIAEECSPAAGGRGDNCRKLENKRPEAYQKLADARAKLIEVGVAQEEDPLARRLARIVPGITQEQVALYYPLLLPLTIAPLGIVLLAAGLSRTKAPQPPAPPQKRKRLIRKKGKRAAVKKPARKPVREPGQLILFPRREDLPRD